MNQATTGVVLGLMNLSCLSRVYRGELVEGLGNYNLDTRYRMYRGNFEMRNSNCGNPHQHIRIPEDQRADYQIIPVLRTKHGILNLVAIYKIPLHQNIGTLKFLFKSRFEEIWRGQDWYRTSEEQ